MFQVTASLLQPVVGLYTDRRPQPYSLPLGMACTLLGMVTLAFAPNYLSLLVGRALLGLGSAIFHPESVAPRQAGLGRRARARTVAFSGRRQCRKRARAAVCRVYHPAARTKQSRLVCVGCAGRHMRAGGGGRWYQSDGHARTTKIRIRRSGNRTCSVAGTAGDRRADCLIFSKFFYLASITSYYIFYLMHRFDLPTETAQIYLFVFLAAAAAGVFLGGPIGDRFGRKKVIWGSIVGVLPFTLALPYVGLTRNTRSYSVDRPHSVVRVLSDCCLRSGANARPSRHGFRSFFRPGFRDGRYRRSSTR